MLNNHAILFTQKMLLCCSDELFRINCDDTYGMEYVCMFRIKIE